MYMKAKAPYSKTPQQALEEEEVSPALEEMKKQLKEANFELAKTLISPDSDKALTKPKPRDKGPEPIPEQEAAQANHRPTKGKRAQAVYDGNAARAKDMKVSPGGGQKADLGLFLKSWNANKARYEGVATDTGIPAALIAALHWRESTGNFGTYLHQGDPLGKPAVHVPKDIPLFHKWEDAAVHALKSKKTIQSIFSITQGTTDIVALASYAEYYNGLGYYFKKKPSPYVWSGTDQYSSGKYVADGTYSPTAKDKQLGVAMMIQSIWNEENQAAEGGD
jgi:lysozyme family protein